MMRPLRIYADASVIGGCFDTEFAEPSQRFFEPTISQRRRTCCRLGCGARVDAIVSWNFKHIVRLHKMKAFNQINLLNGYGILTIISPNEVSTDDDEIPGL